MDVTDGSDGAGYVDAATIALRFASVELGPALDTVGASTPGPLEVTPRQLRDVMGCLVTGVCVVTTVAEGEDVAMTVSSVTSVSLDPPLILVCVARTARFHRAFAESDTWGLSILDGDAAEVSARFSRPGRPRSGQLDSMAHHRGSLTGVALLDGSCAFVECRTETVYPGGDHTIILGRVLAATQSSESSNPLLYHRGTYRWLR